MTSNIKPYFIYKRTNNEFEYFLLFKTDEEKGQHQRSFKF